MEKPERNACPHKESRTAMQIAPIAVTALLLLGTGAAQEISNDYSKADFAHFKTYAGENGHGVDEPLNQSIVSSIDGQLSAKGLTKIGPGGDPDLRVSYDAVFDHDIRGRGLQGRFAEPSLEERFQGCSYGYACG